MRTFSAEALAYLQSRESLHPQPTEKAEQLKEVRKLTTVGDENPAGYVLKEITEKQIDWYWNEIRDCEPSRVDARAGPS